MVYFNGALVVVVFLQFVWMIRQENWMRRNVEIAKDSADAAVNASKPFLFPRAINTESLHPKGPIPDGTKHIPGVSFIFENYGATPGIVREVRADLFLSEAGDEIPSVPVIADLTMRRHDALIIIPGNTYWDDAVKNARSVIDCDFRTLTTEELRQVIAEADTINSGYRRFFLIGRIIYNNFFGIQTTHMFCLKLRAHGFQAIRGGNTYNSITREKIPA